MKTFDVTEGTSAVYTTTIVDGHGAAVPGSVLSLAQLSIRDIASGDAINGRTDQNVLNANGVTIDESGVLVWTITPADNTVLNPEEGFERHLATFKLQWGLDKQLLHAFVLNVAHVKGAS